MSGMFVILWCALVGVLVVITCVNAYFIARLSALYPDLYRALGRPTPFFFATGGWLTSRRFTRFLLSRDSSEALNKEPALLRTARLLASLYIALLLTLLGATLSLLLGL